MNVFKSKNADQEELSRNDRKIEVNKRVQYRHTVHGEWTGNLQPLA